MAGAKNHDYHILPPSINPLIGSFAALTMFFGLVMMFQPKVFGGYGSLVFGGGLIAVLYTFWTWWSDVIKEAPCRRPYPGGFVAPALRHDPVHCL